LYAFLGAWLGAIVVITAWVFAVELGDRGWTGQSILLAHRENPLFWFVDVTPLYLGWLGWILGLNERLHYHVWYLQQRLLDVPTLETPTPRPLSEEPTLEFDLEGPFGDATTVDRESKHMVAVARFAHELRTPLNAIIGYSEMVLEELEEEGRTALAEDVNRVVGASRHLLELMNTALDLARIQAQSLPLTIESLPVGRLVEEVIETVRPLALEHENDLSFSVPPEPLVVRADALRVRQVLLNLLGNACKFTEKGKISLRLEAGQAEAEGYLLFHIEDTGIGMAPEQLVRLFREFSQAAGVHQQYGGSGLGLAISKRLAELMDGRIVVDSTEGVGSTFTVYLPASLRGRIVGRTADARLTLEAGTPPGMGEETTRPAPHLLVVHGDRAFGDLVRSVGVASGFRVDVAPSGAEGLERARRELPSVVLVGHELADSSGLEVVVTLKERRGGDRLPVVFVGPRGLSGPALEAGVAEALPWPPELTGLGALLRRYRLRRVGCSILLVEPVEALAQALEDAFLRDGWAVQTVSDGLAALESWRGDPPDAVVVDVGKPDGEANAFLERLSEEEAWEGVPVLAFATRTVVGWSFPQLAELADRVVVCGSDHMEEAISTVRNGVGDLLAAVEDCAAG
jgi:signal transduction histidine kinase/DNA-binding response OmpR family regulator